MPPKIATLNERRTSRKTAPLVRPTTKSAFAAGTKTLAAHYFKCAAFVRQSP
jgi:hypothetical protein